MSTMKAALILTPVLLLAGCQDADFPMPAGIAEAELINPNGEVVGAATLNGTDAGVEVSLQVSHLKPGKHGFHIHEGGSCETPDFKSAGSHYNPTGAQHGFDANGGPHLGDLYNLDVDESGEVETDRTIDNVTLAGDESILGKTIVIHAKPDDYQSQPSGDAGARVACGVIGPPTPTMSGYR